MCVGYTACLVVPSVAVCANDLGKHIVLFEKDNRFRSNGGVKFVKYDLYRGLNKINYRKYANRFDTVICDLPFNMNLDVLADDIYELLNHSLQCEVDVIYPQSRSASLRNAMRKRKMMLAEVGFMPIEYARPPKLVRYEGPEAIQIYRFSLLL